MIATLYLVSCLALNLDRTCAEYAPGDRVAEWEGPTASTTCDLAAEYLNETYPSRYKHYECESEPLDP